MKIIPFLIVAFMISATAYVAQAAPKPPFYGVWSCTTVNEGNTIDVSHWWQERFDTSGIITEGTSSATKLAIRKIGPGKFSLAYADGGKAQIIMKEPWMFLRHTAEHGYLCLRQSSR
jgi:hypothetical protein